MNLRLLLLLPALSMTVAKPIPIESGTDLDPNSYDGPFPKNLDLVQGAPTLENSNVAYSGTQAVSSFDTIQFPTQLPSNFDQASSFHLAENTPVDSPKEQPKVRIEDGTQAHCCKPNAASDIPAGCKCSPIGKEPGRDSGGGLGGQPGRQAVEQQGRDQGGQEGKEGRQEVGDSPGIWQLYVEPWMCANIPWTC